MKYTTQLFEGALPGTQFTVENGRVVGIVDAWVNLGKRYVLVLVEVNDAESA